MSVLGWLSHAAVPSRRGSRRARQLDVPGIREDRSGRRVTGAGRGRPEHHRGEVLVNVLIVDDQPSARTMLRHVVEGIGPGIRVSDFGNPVEALRWSEGNGADLLLLDYRMPEMDGLEFARRFRRSLSRRDVPIVLISVVGDEPVRQAALCQLLQRPVDLQRRAQPVVPQFVQDVIGGQRARRMREGAQDELLIARQVISPDVIMPLMRVFFGHARNLGCLVPLHHPVPLD